MRIEIFVVTTELKNGFPENAEKWSQLESVKTEIIHEFGGLTESGEEKGYFDTGSYICVDTVKRWLIYVNKVKRNEKSVCSHANNEQLDIATRINHTYLSYHVHKWKALEELLVKIQKITQQNIQAFAINNTLFLL